MANYTIVRACGHEAQVKVRGATPARERTLDRERQRICRSCAIEKLRSEAEASAEAGELPALIGTPKQIAWAVTLRHKALVDVEAYLDYLRESGQLKGRVGRDVELFETQRERVPLGGGPDPRGLHRFRRLGVSYERRADIHEAFLSPGCSIICFRRLTPFCQGF